MFVLGVDPGLSRCGYCCLDTGGRKPVARSLGVITTPPTAPIGDRLAELQADIRGLIECHRPDVLAIERIFFQVNVQTAMSVGQASGVVMAEAGAAGVGVVEYTPNQVKEAVAGHGSAGKDQMIRMVQMLLDLSRPPRPADAADAAAVALTHAAHHRMTAAAATATDRVVQS
ncbi:MAG: crossover junction endodeoxyribonuclease RuvC [Acidimicrobiia bacterium]|nr:crossover junction endodeoxyribonuclease RuvC [Acidimicrobiia bacterium]